MLFYVPPLLPVMGKMDNGHYANTIDGFFSGLESARLPIKYLANLFSAGNVEIIEYVMKKLIAVRYYRRSLDMGDIDLVQINRMMREGNVSPEEAEEIYRLTALATVDQRFVIPPLQREEAISETCNPELCRGSCGLGVPVNVERGP